MKKFNKNIFYLLITVFTFHIANISVEAIDYEAEAVAAERGRIRFLRTLDLSSFVPSSLVCEELVPSRDEIKGEIHSTDKLQHIKVRLPIDLERIINEYKETNKPISIAVSCGDRELPWRANVAARMNDPSRPVYDDFWDDLDEAKIDYGINKENYISIDPLLGITCNKAVNRGAGHIIMDAMNSKHWQQFAEFLKGNSLKIHQIIFTAGMGDPQTSLLEKNNTILPTQLEILEPTGKLVEPYFLTYYENFNENFGLFPVFPTFQSVNSRGEVSLRSSLCPKLGYMFEKGMLREFKFDNRIHVTKCSLFIELCEKHTEGKDIKHDIDALIEENYKSFTPAYKTFTKELAMHFMSIANLDGMLKNNPLSTNPSRETILQQIRKVIPIYTRYFANLGYSAEFLTNPKVAQVFDIPEIKAQDWRPGNYPYGERDHIALILQKI